MRKPPIRQTYKITITHVILFQFDNQAIFKNLHLCHELREDFNDSTFINYNVTTISSTVLFKYGIVPNMYHVFILNSCYNSMKLSQTQFNNKVSLYRCTFLSGKHLLIHQMQSIIFLNYQRRKRNLAQYTLILS